MALPSYVSSANTFGHLIQTTNNLISHISTTEVDANTTVSGFVNTTSQTFAGNKTFQNAASFSNTVSITGAANALGTLGVSGAVNALSTLGVSGAVNALSTLGVSGTLTVNAISANGAVGDSGQFLTSNGTGTYWSALSIVDANVSTSGLVNTATQTFAGNKTFQNAASFSNTVSITGAANALSTLGVSGTLTVNAISANGSTGAGNQILSSNSTGGIYWGPYANVSMVAYTATLANCENTVAETTICSFTVPANSWANGGIIEVFMVSTELNDTGANRAVLFKVYAGAGGAATYTSDFNAPSGTVRRTARSIRLSRLDSTVVVGAAGFDARPEDFKTSTPTNFTSDFTVAIKVTFPIASASLYVRPNAVRVIHTL